jgi:hypothetical protein
MHVGALTRTIQIAGDTRVSQHANMSLPDWPPVPGKPDLEVMRPTEDAIPPRPRQAGRVAVAGETKDEGNGEETMSITTDYSRLSGGRRLSNTTMA